MSMYDKFRAPQFVDFANLLRNDAASDASSFFDRDLENDSVASVNTRHSSTTSFNGTFSDGDATLTPSKFNTSCFADDAMEDDTSLTSKGILSKKKLSGTPLKETFRLNGNTPTPKICSQSCSTIDGASSNGGLQKCSLESPSLHDFTSPNNISTPMIRKCEDAKLSSTKKRMSYATRSSTRFQSIAPRVTFFSDGISSNDQAVVTMDTGSSSEQMAPVMDNLQESAVQMEKVPMDSSMEQGSDHNGNVSSQNVSCKFVEHVRIVCIPPTPNQSSAHEIDFGSKSISRPSRCSGVIPGNKRRSKSAGSAKRTPKDAGEILQEAFETLTLSGKLQHAERAAMHQSSGSPINVIPPSTSGSKQHMPKTKVSNAKRKLSPPPKNARDYSRPPEKYMSMAEQIARNQRRTPSRFRTVPVNKKAVQPNVVRNERMAQKEVGVIGEEGKDKGVRVARWPAPKVEPFKLVEYKTEKKKALPKTVFNFESNEKILLRNRKTPARLLKTKPQTTKTEPFSFDKRDQELLQRKINRMKGIEPAHSCQTRRRRSMSQSDAHSKTADDPLVHHARPPTVLYKAPFIPHKSTSKITKPVDFCLNTEKRAKEREEYDAQLRQKELERQAALHELQEKRRLKEEQEILRLRKELVPKAHPMPVYRPFKIHHNDVPLTDPHSPSFMHRPKISHHASASVPDEPMED